MFERIIEGNQMHMHANSKCGAIYYHSASFHWDSFECVTEQQFMSLSQLLCEQVFDVQMDSGYEKETIDFQQGIVTIQSRISLILLGASACCVMKCISY